MTHPKIRSTAALAVVSALISLAGCGGSGDSGPDTGTLRLGITDSPVDQVSAVVVQFTGVELKPKNGPAFSRDFTTPKSIELLSLQGVNREMLLENETVPAGEYEWLRLKVNVDPDVRDSYVTMIDGSECEMRIPSGNQTGLKLIRGFTVGVGTVTDFTLDFDLRKSLIEPPGQASDSTTCDGRVFQLKPVLRMVDNLQVGAIGGAIDPSLLTPAACINSPVKPGNVYLFGPVAAGTDPATVVPDDVDGIATDGADPLASALVSDVDYSYTIGFVPPGKYVVAYTCDADSPLVDADATDTPPLPAVDEAVSFTPAAGIVVDVTANQIVTVDFAAPPPG
jgi:hypothetical protein